MKGRRRTKGGDRLFDLMLKENPELKEGVELQRAYMKQYLKVYNKLYHKIYYMKNRDKVLARTKARYERIKKDGKVQEERSASK